MISGSADAGASGSKALPKGKSRSKLLKVAMACLDDAKAENVVCIDLAGKTQIADHMVVASGRSHRHVGAIANQLLDALKDNGFGSARIEGLPHCDWVLIDAGDLIVHVFRPEVRDFYNLEKLWAENLPTEQLAM